MEKNKLYSGKRFVPIIITFHLFIFYFWFVCCSDNNGDPDYDENEDDSDEEEEKEEETEEEPVIVMKKGAKEVIWQYFGYRRTQGKLADRDRPTCVLCKTDVVCNNGRSTIIFLFV